MTLQTVVTKLTNQQSIHQVIEHDQIVSDAKEVLNLIKKHRATVVEAVLPLPILAELMNPLINRSDVPIIRAVMEKTLGRLGEEAYTFKHYERILKVEVQVEEL